MDAGGLAVAVMAIVIAGGSWAICGRLLLRNWVLPIAQNIVRGIHITWVAIALLVTQRSKS